MTSVRGKLAAAITLVIGAIAVLIYLFLPARLERQALRALAAKLASISEMTAFSASAALDFRDDAGVTEAIQGALRNPDLAYLVVRNDSGRVVVAINRREGKSLEPLAVLKRPGVSSDVYRDVEQIQSAGRPVGTLYLGLFLTDLRAEVAAARRTTAIGSTVLLLLGAAAAFGIGTFVSRPLRDMVVVAERIARGDLTQRAVAHSGDEVSVLAASFNAMVESLGAAQDQLSEINRNLESRVSDRTTELRSSEARFRGVVGSLAEGVIVLDGGGIIQFSNPRASVLVGSDADALVGRDLEAVLRPSDSEDDLLDGLTRRVREGKTFRGEVRHTREDGSTIWLEVGAMALRHDDGTISGTVATLWELTERKGLEEKLRYDAGHDSLTGLPNRASFHDRLNHALTQRGEAGEPNHVAVLFLDLDDFKVVNDSLGHSAGDRLLQEVAARLLNATRGCDTVARLGGDEFAVLVQKSDGEPNAEVVAERILSSLGMPVSLGGSEVKVDASIGIARAGTGSSADELIRNADVAMYSAKQSGKHMFAFFAPEMHDAVVARIEVEAELRAALERNELRVHYQPIVDLGSGRITGVEALVRWEHPRRGLIGPNAFIPVAETTGLIVPLGRWVLNEACRQAVAWQREIWATGAQPTDLLMSVNVSTRQLHDGPQLVACVRDAIATSGLDPRFLQLEITETLIMSDAEATLKTLRALSAIGVQLAIDDFGTGYSSLSYLERFPVDALKIDKEFVDRLTDTDTKAPLLSAIVRLGSALGLRVVAEGIEQPTQAVRLFELGCQYGQGYYFAKPLPAAAIFPLLLEPVVMMSAAG